MSHKYTKRKSNRRKKTPERAGSRFVSPPNPSQPVPDKDRTESPRRESDRTATSGLSRQLVTAAYLIVISSVLVWTDSYTNAENKVSDTFINFNQPVEDKQQVVIVQIDDEDFRSIFNSSIPLAPASVSDIVKAISLGEPKGLGIDIFTPDEMHKLYQLDNSPFPIVWASSSIKENDKIYKVLAPIGGMNLPFNHFAGLPDIPQGEGTQRYYQRIIETGPDAYPSFPWQLYSRVYPTEETHKSEDPVIRFIRFAGMKQLEKRLIISASQVLKMLQNGDRNGLRGFFKNRIVILGGTFSDAKDEKTIPTGVLSSINISGAELMAIIVETEIYGDPYVPTSDWIGRLLNLAMTIFFILTFAHFGFGWKAALIGIFACAVSAFGLSLLLYGSPSGILRFLGILIILLIISILDVFLDWYKEKLNIGFNRLIAFFRKV